MCNNINTASKPGFTQTINAGGKLHAVLHIRWSVFKWKSWLGTSQMMCCSPKQSLPSSTLSRKAGNQKDPQISMHLTHPLNLQGLSHSHHVTCDVAKKQKNKTSATHTLIVAISGTDACPQHAHLCLFPTDTTHIIIHLAQAAFTSMGEHVLGKVLGVAAAWMRR